MVDKHESDDVFEMQEMKTVVNGDGAGASSSGPKFISRYARVVLIPVEDLESGKRAISHYLNECRKQKDRLYLFHSVHLNPTTNIGGTSGLFHSEQRRRQIRQKKGEIKLLQDNLEKFLDDHDVLATFYARDGDKVGSNIIRFAREKGANLIVMAAKEQNRIAHVVLGQTSDYVLKHASGITVTVVPAAPMARTRLQRHDSDTSCPGDLTYGHRKRALHFLKPIRRRLHSEPSVLQINDNVIAEEEAGDKA